MFAELPGPIVELGPGVAANLRPGSTLVAIEPNPPMHGRLRAAAKRHGVHLDLRDTSAERTGLPSGDVETVISSLVLCTVTDPAEVLAEIRRILRPGGTFRFVEHVVARVATPTRALQRALRRPGSPKSTSSRTGCTPRSSPSTPTSRASPTPERHRYDPAGPPPSLTCAIQG